MQDVARRAVDSCIRGHEPEVLIGVLIDAQIDRYAGAVAHLSRWRD